MTFLNIVNLRCDNFFAENKTVSWYLCLSLQDCKAGCDCVPFCIVIILIKDIK